MLFGFGADFYKPMGAVEIRTAQTINKTCIKQPHSNHQTYNDNIMILCTCAVTFIASEFKGLL